MPATPITEIADPRVRLETILERLNKEATRRKWNLFYDEVVRAVNIEQVNTTFTYKGVITLTIPASLDSKLEEAFQSAGFNEASFITVRRNFEFIRVTKGIGVCSCPKTKAQWAEHKELLLADLKKKMSVERITINKDDRLDVHCTYCAP